MTENSSSTTDPLVAALQRDLAAHKAHIAQLEAQLAIMQTRSALLEGVPPLQELVEHIPHILWTANAVGEVTFCNPYGLAVFGRTLPEIAGLNWLDVVHPDDQAEVKAMWQESLNTGQPYHHQFRMYHAGQAAYRWYVVDSLPLKNKAGHVENWYGISIDIHEQVQNQTEHLNHQRFLRSVVDTQTNYVVRTDLEGRYTFINEAFKTQFNLTEAILGEFYFSTVYEEDIPACQQAAEVCVTNPGKVVSVDMRKPVFAPSSQRQEVLWYLWSRWEFVAITDEDGNLQEVQAVGRDITPQKKTEADLALMTDRLKLAAESAQLGVWDLDIKNDSLIWNDRMRDIYGFSEVQRPLKYADWKKSIHPDDAQRAIEQVQRAIETGDKFEAKFRIVTPAGEEKHILSFAAVFLDDNQQPARMIGINQDVTEQYYFEQQLRQTQKMEALGQLAGGVAHNFNNILTALLGHAALALEALSHQHPARQDLKNIHRIGERASKITQQLLAFTRQQNTHPKIVSLNSLIKDIQTMLPHLIRSNIQLTLNLGSNQPPVKVDPYQIEQVIINLVLNARDAMPNGGELTLSTQSLELNQIQAQPKNLPPGTYIKLSVSDTGSGIDPALHRRIFDPFFTTKEAGQGTGLGLSTCLGIVQQNHGHINVESVPGQGACFNVYLPAVPQTEAQTLNPVEPPPLAGSETVVLVEDELSVRNLISRILKTNGYRVKVFADIEEAIGYLKGLQTQSQPLPHLILCDVIMPNGTGYQLIEYLKETEQAIPFILMSGYQTNETMQSYLKQDTVSFLSKPFDPQTLLAHVRKSLDSH